MTPIRVLVADDSPTVRQALASLLSEDPAIQVVGQAADGLEAVALAQRLRPHVITMDVQMPLLSGLDAIERIMAEAPSRILVVCSVSEGREVNLSFRAMAAGAMELIAKPTAGVALRAWGARVAEAVRLMAEVPVVRRRGKGSWARLDLPERSSRAVGTEVIGLVASTGGPAALASVLGALPKGFPCPLLVAQHMAPGFGTGLRRWLGEVSALAVTVAEPDQPLVPGFVYLAPDGHDLEVGSDRRLRTVVTRGGHCPSGDRLLGSLAAALGRRAAGVVMTGMGEDGAEGLLAIRRAGGRTLAQDEATSVVYGMPRVAFELGAAEVVLPLGAIPVALASLAGCRSAPSSSE